MLKETTLDESIGRDMHNLMTELYPICRSITGNGVRETISILKKYIPLQIHEVPTGTKVFDWQIPKEWNIKDAYVKDSKGVRIIDFQKSTLHVLNYSIPVNKKMNFDELKEHLFTLPDNPEWIPYLTSYYKDNWGFCISQNHFDTLDDTETYEVVIDSSLTNGNLTYAELFLQGEVEEEVMLTTYFCHPSLCNDNLSGVVILTYIAKYLMGHKLKYSYRFLFIPETIGSITWLSRNEDKTTNIKYGLVVTCAGDPGKSTYKKSRMGNSLIDSIVPKILEDSKEPYEILDFFPMGSDERQFCSPGFNLPFGSLMRTPYGRFQEYHTSADNLEFVTANSLKNTIQKYIDTVYLIENNKTYNNLNPKCEPQLGKRGLYRIIGSQKTTNVSDIAMFWILNLSDGTNSLLDIAVRSKITFRQIKETSDVLYENGLLE